MSYSSPCQLLGFSFQLLPPSLPLLLVWRLLVSGMASLCPVLLWRCTALDHLSGILPTPAYTLFLDDLCHLVPAI